MSELPHVHAPSQRIHGWRDFLVHIAVVTIGLLLAIGLQQLVEIAHHRHQRAQLEEQMRQSLEADLITVRSGLQRLDRLHGFLIQLRNAVDARVAGRTPPGEPAASDPRNFTYVPPPNLGTYEAAKANGTVALLSADRIRLYERIEYGYRLIDLDLQRYMTATIDLRAFGARFDRPPAAKSGLPTPELRQLTPEELLEYRALIGKLIAVSDGYAGRLRRLELQSRALLDGALDERALRDVVDKDLTFAPGSVSPGNR